MFDMKGLGVDEDRASTIVKVASKIMDTAEAGDLTRVGQRHETSIKLASSIVRGLEAEGWVKLSAKEVELIKLGLKGVAAIRELAASGTHPMRRYKFLLEQWRAVTDLLDKFKDK